MNVRYTRAALDDLSGIAAYLRLRNPEGLLRVRDDIRASVRALQDYPFSGREQDIVGVRKSVTPRYRYLVFYHVDEGAEAVDILAIQHPAQHRSYQDT